MENIKLSLVSKSGILLASIPETEDDMQEILASGLISAIIAYAKEMHSRELQSISYYDRTISFVEFQEFVFIVETLDKEFTLSERQTKQLLEQISLSASSLLEGREPETVSEGEAYLILEHCFHDINSLNLILNRYPLKKLMSEFFTILHKVKGIDILDNDNSKPYRRLIAEIIDNNITKIDQQIKLQSFMILLPEHKKTFYVVFNTDGFTTKVGYFIIPTELDYTLFRIYPLLEKILLEYGKTQKIIDFETLFREFQNFEDLGNNYSKVDLEEVSIASLFNLLRQDLGTVLFAVLSGNPLYIIGDKSVNKLLVDTLSVFTQHLSYNVEKWIVDEDLSTIDYSLLNQGIVGMSLKTFREILPLVQNKEKLTIINLEEESISGPNTSNYFLDNLEKIKYEDATKASVILFQEIKKLVSMAYILTSILTLPKEDSDSFLKNQTEQSPYPKSFLEIAMNLAKQRNKLLNFIF
ncbi:MAG: hypothetical protein KGD64_10390 [Candidatus Heimdallarchaeota archaeon]|nr:hypothetical protein [Candidatus Heimdallarchaeota archaeon]